MEEEIIPDSPPRCPKSHGASIGCRASAAARWAERAAVQASQLRGCHKRGDGRGGRARKNGKAKKKSCRQKADLERLAEVKALDSSRAASCS